MQKAELGLHAIEAELNTIKGKYDKNRGVEKYALIRKDNSKNAETVL